VIKRLLAGLFVGTALSAVALPASAAVDNNLPVRWNTGGAVWSTNQDAFNTFLQSGEVTDRGLEGGLKRSGWTAAEVREGMNKSYNVDFVGVSRFLYSDAGVKFLKNQTTSYFPYWSMNTFAVQALRSAIVADARGRPDLLGRHHAGPAYRHAPSRFLQHLHRRSERLRRRSLSR
jgi:hypothetical protein